MASFNGIDLGLAVEMSTAPNPPALQTFEYPGVNGLGVNFLGGRGGATEAAGVAWGATAIALAAAEDVFRAFVVNGTVGTLIDTTGTTWLKVMLINFRPVGRAEFAPGRGWAREYRMTFLHLL